jgi:hypothetical protein
MEDKRMEERPAALRGEGKRIRGWRSGLERSDPQTTVFLK